MNNILLKNLSKTSPLQLIFEDQYLYLINKPCLLHTTSSKNKNSSVANYLLECDNKLSKASDPSNEAGLINRLDYETSGLLIGAKSLEVFELLKDLQKQEKIKKSYLLITEKRFLKNQLIRTWIGSRYRHSKKVSCLSFEQKKPKRFLASETHFKRLQYNKDFDISLVLAKLNSGRRHQIRAQAAYLGFPLIGDKLYSSTRNLKELSTFALHSYSVSFIHPILQTNLDFQCNLPDYFKKFFVFGEQINEQTQ